MIATIIVITVLVSIMSFNNDNLMNKLLFSPFQIYRYNQFYRMLSYGFVHSDWGHLIINMFVLYSFGNTTMYFIALVTKNSNIFFIFFYLSALVVSTIYSFFKHKNNYSYAAVGASGAVSAVVFASILFYPLGSIRFIFIPINIPAYVFGILYLIYSAYMAKKAKDNVGHDAHFFGAVYGFIFPILIEPSLFGKFLTTIFG